MDPRIARLEKLQSTLLRLKEAIAGRLAGLAEERRQLVSKRETIEALMAGDSIFLDLTLGGALRRLKEIASRIAVIEAQDARLRKRAADAVLKAGRAEAAARTLAAEAAKRAERLALAELTDQRAPASLRQVRRR